MAKKEFSKGDVVNIFGRVIGRGIEFSGGVILFLSKGIARFTRGIFWFVGKHMDMVDTLKERKPLPHRRVIDVGETPRLDKAEHFESLEEIMDRLTPIEQALNYSQLVYENDILPKEEILRIDNQALIMAKAIRNLMNRVKDPQLKKEGIKIMEMFLKISSLSLKYHKTSDKRIGRKSRELLAEVGKVKSCLVRNFLESSLRRPAEEAGGVL